MEKLRMSTENEQKDKKHRNWFKADCGIKFLGEGLVKFVDEAVKAQHQQIMSRFKGKKCKSCTKESLLPKHAFQSLYEGKKCSLNCDTCICLEDTYHRSFCSNGICSEIYDEIIKQYFFRPSTPCWMNTDVQMWSDDPWSIAKCFISFGGYVNKTGPSEIDCTGLMHILINNKGLHDNIECKISRKGDDVFCRVRRIMRQIIKDTTHALSDKDFNNLIHDMIEILEDKKYLVRREESKEAVRKLLKLKNSDLEFITRSPARNRFNSENDSDSCTIDDTTELYRRTPLMSQPSYSSKYESEFYHKSILGHGAYGTVFEAVHRTDTLSYAVKRIRLDKNKSPKRQNEVSKEIKALATLEHPHIVRYFNAWVENPPPGWQEAKDADIDLSYYSSYSTQSSSATQSTSEIKKSDKKSDSTNNTGMKEHLFFYIQMQLCKPSTLEQWLQENTLNRDNQKVLTWFKQISSAVSYIHERGYLHRDLKPSYIFFSVDNEVKVGDFGLATALEEDQDVSYY